MSTSYWPIENQEQVSDKTVFRLGETTLSGKPQTNVDWVDEVVHK